METQQQRNLRAQPASPWLQAAQALHGRHAVHDVSMAVERGEVVGLLGPNGAGKTSVIKMLLGLVRPDAGTVQLLGRPATDPAAGPGGLPAGCSATSGRLSRRRCCGCTSASAASP
ncbi:MAG: ATP-binding cassette domain-containing protein [Acidimicrobiales bacterium]